MKDEPGQQEWNQQQGHHNGQKSAGVNINLGTGPRAFGLGGTLINHGHLLDLNGKILNGKLLNSKLIKQQALKTQNPDHNGTEN